MAVYAYFGVMGDLEATVALAHEPGFPVLVDEAHGVHFSLRPALPPSAMEAGAVMDETSRLR